MCGKCGLAARSFSALSGPCPGRLAAAAAAHASHQLHVADFGEDGGTQQLIACTACGAHGASRVVNLARPCPAENTAVGDRQASHRRQASRVARKLHPSRKDVQLFGMRALCTSAARRVGQARAPAPTQEATPLTQPASRAVRSRLSAHAEVFEHDDLGQEEFLEPEPLPSEAVQADAFELPPEMQDLQAGRSAAPEDYEEDVFDFGGDLGEAAYLTPGSPATEPQQQMEPELIGPVVCAPPPPKKRCTEVRRPQAVAVEDRAAPGTHWVAASLSGVEERLSFMGEVPRFVVAGAGRLQHTCLLAEATVCFWPGALKWEVQGKQKDVVEKALLEPLVDDSPSQPHSQPQPQPQPQLLQLKCNVGGGLAGTVEAAARKTTRRCSSSTSSPAEAPGQPPVARPGATACVAPAAASFASPCSQDPPRASVASGPFSVLPSCSGVPPS